MGIPFPADMLSGQVAIITGGATGIGNGIANRFINLGARVVLASRTQENLDRAVAEITARGGRALAVQTDVRDSKQVDHMVARTLEEFGRIDVLVNNAAGNFICPAEELSVNGWLAVINIVLNGTFFCTRAAGRVMKEQSYGRIVSITAPYSLTGNPGTVHSAAAKAGVEVMSKTLAVEWAKYGIRCNTIAPGPVETAGASSRLWAEEDAYQALVDSIPVKRFGRLEEIADIAAFLVSPYADFINGACIAVDGGQWLPKGMFNYNLADAFGAARE